jgi:hypothetical protein
VPKGFSTNKKRNYYSLLSTYVNNGLYDLKM